MDEPVDVSNDDDDSPAPAAASSQTPKVYALTTSMVDDVFYLLKKSAERGFSTCHVNAGCAVLNHINSVLTRDYKQVLHQVWLNALWILFAFAMSTSSNFMT